MKTSLKVLFLSLFFPPLLCHSAPALESYPPPRAPFVAPVPDNAQWTVTFRAPEEPSETKKFKPIPKGHDRYTMTLVVSTKTGKLKQDQVTFGNGRTVDYWYVDSSIFLTQQGNQTGATLITSEWVQTIPSVPSGFPGTQWIDQKSFDRVVMFNKHPCYHYNKRQDGDIVMEAWINAETNLPVGYRNDTAYYFFEFKAPPPSPLTLPAPYQQALDDIRKELDYRKQLEKDLK